MKDDQDIGARFAALQAGSAARRSGFGLHERKAALRALMRVINRRRPEIIAAVGKDQGKAPDEVDLIEIATTLSELSHALWHLRRWMRPRRVWPTVLMLGTRAHVLPQPKGVALVIAPWNFPVLLALGPVISAIAAGNAVVLKPSEVTPETSSLLAHLCAEAFPDGLVQVVEGGAEAAQALLALPFDHIFFTGSREVGQQVMAAAARNLTPVTLELGGKSPVIIGPDADLARAAGWIAWGKGLNAGQICVAPDHVFVPRALAGPLAEAIRTEFARLYGADAGASPDLCQIVTGRHFDRLRGLVEDARSKGAEIAEFGQDRPERHLMAPKLVTHLRPDMRIQEEEVFGPLLPIIPYDDLDQPILAINAGHKPLILYIFARDMALVDRVSAQTQSGSVGVNVTVIPFVHANFGFWWRRALGHGGWAWSGGV